MAKLLVKQVRSKINCPLDQKRGLEALGLRKMGQVEHDSNLQSLG
jgi:large subunit ribosomal protein L30